jgi:hypothetical protein
LASIPKIDKNKEKKTEYEEQNMHLINANGPIHIDMGVLRRAMQIPEELEYQPQKREYPDPVYDLMVNPNPKKKKKKGKKGKKK